MAKSKEKKASMDRVHKKKDGKVLNRKRVGKGKTNDIKNPQKSKAEPGPSSSLRNPDSKDNNNEIEGDNPEYDREFPSIKEVVSQEAKSKSRKKEKQDVKRKERALELADKTQQKLEKKAAKAAKAANVAKSESESEVKTIIHGLTPPKNIQALTIAANLSSDDAPSQELLLMEDQQLHSTSDKKEDKRLRRLKRVQKREDKNVIVSRPKSLEKLAGLINKRNSKYSGAKFAALLDLAEKILVVSAVPGTTIEQKANKVTKDIADMEMEMEMEMGQPEPEAESNKALVLRAESPKISPVAPILSIRESGYPADQVSIASDETIRCRWKKCKKTFDTLKDLSSHVGEDHLAGIQEGVMQKCRWNHCKTIINQTIKRQHLFNHMHNDFCHWTPDDMHTLRDHVKRFHSDLLTTVPEDPAKANTNDSRKRKRKRSHDDDAAKEAVPSKPSKKRKLEPDAGLTPEEAVNPKSKKRKYEKEPAELTQEEPVNPKQKKRKHEKEAAGNSEDQTDIRPKKKMKS